MSTIKNILFFSCLKNKGIRRLCFVVGVLLSLCILTKGLLHTYNLSQTRLQFENFNKLRLWASVYKDSDIKKFYFLESCTEEYFHKRKIIGFSLAFHYPFERDIVKHEQNTQKVIDNYCHRYPEYCELFTQTASTFISLESDIGERILFCILVSAIMFYLPFILAVIIKLICIIFIWIYKGFREQ